MKVLYIQGVLKFSGIWTKKKFRLDGGNPAQAKPGNVDRSVEIKKPLFFWGYSNPAASPAWFSMSRGKVV